MPYKRCPHRPVRKVDANQSALVRDGRRAGLFIEDTHTLGAGFPDLLVYRYATHTWMPVEVKSGPAEALTPAEVKWWQRAGTPAVIAWDLDSLLAAAGVRADLPFSDFPAARRSGEPQRRVGSHQGGRGH